MGEERKFQVTFPPDYNVELWQNMRADVSVKVKELFWAELPQVRVLGVAAGGCLMCARDAPPMARRLWPFRDQAPWSARCTAGVHALGC